MKNLKTIVPALLLACGLLLSAGVAKADVVTMTFIGAEGNNSFGEYVYPYDLQVNNDPIQQMMCDTFNRNINNGDSWTANRMLLADLNDTTVQNLFYGANGQGNIGATVQMYLAAAYLYNQEVTALANNNSDPQGLYNWATWDLFDPTDVQNRLDAGTLAEVQSLISAAQAAVFGKNVGDFDFSNTTYIYTPTGDVGQEFFGPVPEPGTLAMMGTGILGMAGLMRRKLRA
jgi:hypothetical protein